MALNHVNLNEQLPLGRLAKVARARGLDFLNSLKDLRGAANEFINGDGSLDTHYAPLVTAGFGATNAEAHSGWSQVDTLLSALTTNASQTSVMDKYNQFVNYLGGN